MNDATSSPDVALRSAERMQRHRRRRKKGLRCVMLEVRDRELDALVLRGHLQELERDDVGAVRRAFHRFLDSTLGRKSS